MKTQYACGTEQRRKAVAASHALNGIDYLEINPIDGTTLLVNFLHDLPGSGSPSAVPSDPGAALTALNVAIAGGTRITTITVTGVSVAANVLTVTTDLEGDFSTYTLSLVASPTNNSTPPGFDRQLAAIDFGFRATCPSDFDCQTEPQCPPLLLPEPEIDYQAKDYNSFLRLMLDRLSVIMPGWQERHAADAHMALLELLAYVGDYLSYYQDTVATEAYLGTARFRTSVRRHARLVDYFMHDGSNARTWVYLQVDAAADGAVLPGPTETQQGTTFVTTNGNYQTYIAPADLDDAVQGGSLVFETLHDIITYSAHNLLRFYTWSDEDCCLPRGATRATLYDDALNRLRLRPGDLLIFEEALGPRTGQAADADVRHRHAVRLSSVVPAATVRNDGQTRDPGPLQVDALTQQPIVDIAWDADDALPFALCLSGVSDAEHGALPLADISIARGNIVLCDHGRTRTMLTETGQLVPDGQKLPPPTGTPRYRPQLEAEPLTQQGHVPNPSPSAVLRTLTPFIPFDPAASATAALQWQMSDVHPAVYLSEGTAGGETLTWRARRDLLNSSPSANEFVVETENDGSAFLRFGDNELGRRPDPSTGLRAFYRGGGGAVGNVGHDTITHIVSAQQGIIALRNPLPAGGGVDPQALEEVRLFAPQAFRTQDRAVTVADYAEIVQRRPDIQKAAATIRWTGSWYTYFVTVDRVGGKPVDDAFKDDIRGYLERYRVAGYEVEVNAPVYVSLYLALSVCVKAGYLRADVKKGLLAAFSNQVTGAQRRGFFHPDNFTFGEPIYLSRIYEVAMTVPGVDSVMVTHFERWGQGPRGELENGVLAVGKTEIVRLDNDPNFAENGKLEITLAGGL